MNRAGFDTAGWRIVMSITRLGKSDISLRSVGFERVADERRGMEQVDYNNIRKINVGQIKQVGGRYGFSTKITI